MHKTFHILAIAFLTAAALFAALPAQTARAATRTVTKTADTNDGTCNADCSLREAIAAATAGDTIHFAASLAGYTIHLGSQLTIDKNLVIDGVGLDPQVTVSGDTEKTVLAMYA